MMVMMMIIMVIVVVALMMMIDDDDDDDGEVHGNDVNDNDVINIVLVVSLRLTIPRLHQTKCRFYCLSDSGGLVLVRVLVAFLQLLFSSPVC